MAYTLANLRSDIRNYTEVSDTVLNDAILERESVRLIASESDKWIRSL